MQRYNFRRTLKTRELAIGVVFSFSMGPILRAQCASPSEPLATVRIEGATALEGLFAFGMANKICFGIEFDNDELLQHPIHFEASGETSLSAVRKALAPYQDYLVTGHRLLSVQPRNLAGKTWLYTRIDRFQGGTGPIQVVSNLLFLYLLDQVKPQRGYASHYHLGNVKDVIGPIDERGKTIRELLNVLVRSSKGGIWLTTSLYNRTSSSPDRFWTILQYSDQRLQNGIAVHDMISVLVSTFGKSTGPK